MPSKLVHLFIACQLVACLAGQAQIAEPRGEALDSRIKRLILELGADEFAVRERAQERLAAMGLLAFDELLRAGDHQDIEIAMRARYLVRSLPISWTAESDPVAVQSILRKYAAAGRAERQNRMQQLAALPDSLGVPALCRLTRFEVDIPLSKEAALFAMNHEAPAEQQARTKLAHRIESEIAGSERTAASWLRGYAESLVSVDSAVETWNQLVAFEQETFAKYPLRTERRIVRDLIRWHAEMLRSIDRTDGFLTAVRSSLEFVDGDWRELFDFVDWALEREAWIVVDEVAAKFPSEFRSHARLTYRLAEAQLRRGDIQLATQTADAAHALKPKDANAHTLLADQLQSRLMYDWAEREYRYVTQITKPSPNDGLNFEVHFYLADMLFDLERESAAADVLATVVEKIEKNPDLMKPIHRPLNEIQSSLSYYRAMAYGRDGDVKNQIEELEKAYKFYPENPDFLISMYRVTPLDPEWRATVLTRLATAKEILRARVRRHDETFRNPRDDIERLKAMDGLARALNELAWLVSNTDGDFTSAIQFSQRSLRLKPDNPAYLDTLGRCYYAVGDFESAVLHQRKAVEGAPYQQQIRRQLKLFEDALAAN